MKRIPVGVISLPSGRPPISPRLRAPPPARSLTWAGTSPSRRTAGLVRATKNRPSITDCPHAAPDSVTADFSRLISGLAMNSASTGLEFIADPVAGTSYEFDFNVAGVGQPSLMLPGVALFGGRTYTIYVVGPQAALSGIVTVDN